ncbi:VWA domain-containing protein [Chenggangzhangella methanolivorans]|uniref:VWA domain-containing protein n=1 Tax=Chenggangzhangella methanolivorans TaxID=1437009 RepID=A0A9E6RAA6_9HYPH|nr:VWA domain-containing protein [Chenggangzhangella methanolivorans]
MAGLRRREAALPPPPSQLRFSGVGHPECASRIHPTCDGEGSGVGVLQDKAQEATSLDAQPRRSLRSHPHPHPPHKGEGGGDVAAQQSGTSSVENQASESPPPPRILVRREDFRIQRLKERRRSLTIFVVDASGSAALHRLAEAKGAVELLLAEAYVRRDEVALIAFRGTTAELLLPPTRSLARAKRSLGELPGGGGTPLASAIDAAALLAVAARRRGDAPALVFLTDGQANVSRDGEGGRARAQEEAAQAARALKALGLKSLVIDVSPRPNPRAGELSAAMGARYMPLPSADAPALARAAAS